MDLSEDNLFDHLLDADRRRTLAEALRAEQGSHLPLHWRYGELARTVTDADRLGRAVFALLEETPPHGAMPEERRHPTAIRWRRRRPPTVRRTRRRTPCWTLC